MNSSLEIIRDDNGYFRHPKGLPLVVIFDSKNPKDKPPDAISWQEPVLGLLSRELKENSSLVQAEKKQAGARTKPMKFVNTSRPKVSDKDSKKLVRTRANKDAQRRKYGLDMMSPEIECAPARNATLCRKLPPSLEESTSPALCWQPSLSIDPFTTFPINMEPYMYSLIYRYISITSEVARRSESSYGQDLAEKCYLPLAMNDAALFHTLLCGSALYTDVVSGRRESPEKSKHMNEAIHLLSTRLQDPKSEISDSTIVAVAHLADFESGAGNFANWSLHMGGLYKMVKIRGGLAALSDGLQSKIWRADISGCVSTLSKPQFTSIDLLGLSLPSLSPKPPTQTLCDGLRSIAEILNLDEDLIGILDELQYLTSLLNNTTMNFLTINRLSTSIYCHLVSLQYSHPDASQESITRDLCCVGSLIYLKTVYDFHLRRQLRGRPAGAAIDGAMIQRLKPCLSRAEINVSHTRGLFLWTLLLGGVAVGRSRDRAWFVARLAKAIMELQICSWEDAKSLLMRFFWVDRIHEDACKDLWDEASVTVDVLFGGDC